jgi:chlorophyll(ide) b reductase
MLKLNHRQVVKAERSKRDNLNVVITGGSRGLGKAFAREFSKQGDNVFVIARSQQDIDQLCKSEKNITGWVCDVSDRENMKRVVDGIVSQVDMIDVWINNAGVSGGSRKLLELSDDKIEDIIKTNLIGTCVSCKVVHEVMAQQNGGGAIFNLAGAGSDGGPTPNYSVYGASKAGIVQMTKSLQKEWKDSPVDLHVISPGMMLTDLLIDNISIDTLQVIDFLCTHPELVALHLVPRIKRAYYYHEDSYIRFLTVFKVLGKILTHKIMKN